MLFFFLLPSSLTHAEGGQDSNGCKPVMSEEKKASVEKFKEEDASLQESYTVDFLEAFWNMVNINALDTLIFGNPYCIWFDKEPELVFGIFPVEQKEKIIDPIFNLFTGAYVLILVLSMMNSGIKRAYGSLGVNKTAFQDDVLMYITTSLLLVSYWLMIEQVLNINFGIVNSFRTLLEAQGINLNTALIVAGQDDFNFTDIIIMLAEFVLMLFLNFVYIMRSFMIVILLGLGGLAILSLTFESTRSYFGTWFQDFAGAVFMQSVHAFYLTIVLLFTSTMSGEGAVFFKLFLLIMFIPLSTTILNWMGLSSGNIATSTGTTGVNSIAGAMRMAGAGKKMLGKQPSKLSSLGNTKISSLATGSHSKSWQTAKSVFSKGAMVAGAMAGSVVGPGGAVLGGQLAGKGAGALLQAPRNIAGGVKGAVDTIKTAKTDGFKGTMSDISKRREFFGNLGESSGALIGAGGAGRSVGHALSGVSRQRLLNSSELGGFRGNTLSQIAQQNPGATMSWMQTNQGSGLYLNNGGDLKQISPLGAADPSLNNGERRMIDYQLPQSGFQENQGMYSHSGNDSLLKQTSGSYLQNAGGQTLSDPRVQGQSISPDSYFTAGMPIAKQSVSDKVANRISRNKGFV